MRNNNKHQQTLMERIKERERQLARSNPSADANDALKNALNPDEFFFDEETRDLYANKHESDTGDINMVEIYDREQFTQALGRLDDDRDPRHDLYSNMLKTEPKRLLASVTQEKLCALDGLKHKFPNYYEVLTDFKELLELEYFGESKIIKHPPILLNGPPGIGKTRLLNEVAKVLDVGHVRVLDMASTSHGFVISGNSTKWKDGGQGEVTKALQYNAYANPIIVLDEIDKASKGDYQVLGPLYSLLESHSAAKFVDEALELPMNCAHLLLFATSNNLDDVPTAIQSRFDIYHVDMPTNEQMRNVVDSVFGELLSENDWGICFNTSLPEAVMTMLQQQSPRDLKKNLWKACAKALQRDKCMIGKRDDLIALLPVDFGENLASKQKNAIGFY